MAKNSKQSNGIKLYWEGIKRIMQQNPGLTRKQAGAVYKKHGPPPIFTNSGLEEMMNPDYSSVRAVSAGAMTNDAKAAELAVKLVELLGVDAAVLVIRTVAVVMSWKS